MQIMNIPKLGSSRVYWTGGTSGISNTVEWYDKDLLSTLELFENFGFSNKEYVLSTVSGGMGMLGASIDMLCLRWNLSNISLGSSAPNMIQTIRHFIKTYPIKIIFSTPQGAVRIAQGIDDLKSSKGIQVIITSGAPLLKSMYSLLKNKTKSKIIDLYGCTEVSVCGITCDYNYGFHIEQRNVIVEILEPDEKGLGKVVITSLKNSLQPVIRYLNGDLGTIITSYCKCGLTSPRLILHRRISETIYIGGTKIEVNQIDEALNSIHCYFPYQLCYITQEQQEPYLELRFIGKNFHFNKDTFFQKLNNINPALYMKISSKDFIFKITNIHENEIIHSKGDKYPRLVKI